MATTPLGSGGSNGLSGTANYEPDLSSAFLAQSRVGAIYAAVITVSIASTIAVTLRFICRRMMKAHLWWDDWTILAALLIEWSLSAVLFYATANLNFGRHVELMKDRQLIPYGRTLIATQLLYYCAQTTIKMSLLLMYYRTFFVNKRFRIAIYAAGTLTIIWFLAAFLDTIFQCKPIEASWSHSILNAKCQDIEKAALGTGISNLILDVLFIALPVLVIWDIKLPKRIKASLTGIFLLGVFVCVTSIMRIRSIVTTDWSKTDLTWDSFGINIWSTVESCCAIIGACLPTMKPLITNAKRLTHSAGKTTLSGQHGTAETQEASSHTGPTTISKPQNPRGHIWKPPLSRASNWNAKYADFGEEDDLESGPNMYPMENMEAGLIHDIYMMASHDSEDKTSYRVLKSPTLRPERSAGTLSTPESLNPVKLL